MLEEQARKEEKRGSGPILMVLWSVCALASLALAACSGSGGGGTPALASDPPPADSPDLVAVELSFTVPSVAAGATMPINDVVQNVGFSLAEPFSIAVHLSEDDVIDSSDIQLAVRSLAGLEAGAFSTGGGMVTIPSSVPPGTWHVGILVDVFDDVVELDETNNSIASETMLEVTPTSFPNLRAASVSVGQSVVEAGQVLQVTDTVDNLGSGTAGNFVVGIHLSTDSTITSTDLMIGVRAVTQLAPGQESMATGPITVPLSTQAGTWYVGIVADVQDDITESDEFDNTAVAAQTVEITAPPLPDLAVGQLSFSPVTVDVGSLLEVSDSVSNIGIAASIATQSAIYLSSDAVVTEDDLLIGTRAVPALGVGEDSSVSSSFVIPTGTPGGNYHVGVIVDRLGVVPELSEANNVFASSALVTVVVPPLPDMAMTGFSFTPGVITAGAGGTLSITDTVVNQGVLSSGSFRVGLYLSTNTAITGSDLLVGSRMITNLAPGESSTATTPIPIQTTIPGGSWFVGAIADDLQAVTEATIGNNTIFAGNTLDVVASPDPMPDLDMRNLTFNPHTVVAGTTLSFQDQVRNIGTLSSGTFHVGVYLSDDDQVTTDDLMIAERIVFNLAIEFGSASSFQAVLPNDLAEGDYFIGAIADNRMVVMEGDEENNVFRTISGLNVFVPPPPAPDILMTELTFTPSDASPGDTISISDTTRNGGNLDTSSSIQVAFYLSEDGEITSDDLYLGSRDISGLDSAQVSSGTTQLTLPDDLELGTWRVGAIIDGPDAVDESDEDNNTRVASGNLEIQ